jgi:glycosyltransferase involved in cell wall biosynthesis
MPRISVITPTNRGVKNLDHLIRDFRNQTLPKDQWEHVIVYDGTPPDDVKVFMKIHEKDYDLKFVSIDKDPGNMQIAPGTRPRNHGVSIASGEYVVFFDDDDRAKDLYLETLSSGTVDDMISVVQMSCQESRMYRNGNPNRIILIPEIGLHEFPVICHVGTPCFIVKRAWALECPWQHEPEHDYRFIKRIVEKYQPRIQISGGMLVDVDRLVTRGLRDWVTHPPFYR